MRSYIVATRGVRRARSDGRSDPLAGRGGPARAASRADARASTRAATADRPGGAATVHTTIACHDIDGITICNFNARRFTHVAHTDTQDAATHRRASATQIPLPTGRVHADTTTTKIELYNNSELDARAVLKDPPYRRSESSCVARAKAVPSRYRSAIYLHGTPACWARRSPSTAMPLASCALTPTCAATWLG